MIELKGEELVKKIGLSTGGSVSLIWSVVWGVLAVAAVSIVLMIGLTSLIEKGVVVENRNIGVFVIRLVAIVAGGLLGTGFLKGKILPAVIAISSAYFVFLLLSGVVFLDGSLHNVWQGILSVAVGTVIVLIVKLKPQKIRRKAIRVAR